MSIAQEWVVRCDHPDHGGAVAARHATDRAAVAWALAAGWQVTQPQPLAPRTVLCPQHRVEDVAR